MLLTFLIMGYWKLVPEKILIFSCNEILIQLCYQHNYFVTKILWVSFIDTHLTRYNKTTTSHWNWTCYYWNPFGTLWSNLCPQPGFSTGMLNILQLFGLVYLVPWNNHLPPVSLSAIQKCISNDSWLVGLTLFFRNFYFVYIFTYIFIISLDI